MNARDEFYASVGRAAYKMGASEEEEAALREICVKLGKETIYSKTQVAMAAGWLSDNQVPTDLILTTKLPQVLTVACQQGFGLNEAAAIVAKMT